MKAIIRINFTKRSYSVTTKSLVKTRKIKFKWIRNKNLTPLLNIKVKHVETGERIDLWDILFDKSYRGDFGLRRDGYMRKNNSYHNEWLEIKESDWNSILKHSDDNFNFRYLDWKKKQEVGCGDIFVSQGIIHGVNSKTLGLSFNDDIEIGTGTLVNQLKMERQASKQVSDSNKEYIFRLIYKGNGVYQALEEDERLSSYFITQAQIEADNEKKALSKKRDDYQKEIDNSDIHVQEKINYQKKTPVKTWKEREKDLINLVNKIKNYEDNLISLGISDLGKWKEQIEQWKGDKDRQQNELNLDIFNAEEKKEWASTEESINRLGDESEELRKKIKDLEEKKRNGFIDEELIKKYEEEIARLKAELAKKEREIIEVIKEPNNIISRLSREISDKREELWKLRNDFVKSRKKLFKEGGNEEKIQKEIDDLLRYQGSIVCSNNKNFLDKSRKDEIIRLFRENSEKKELTEEKLDKLCEQQKNVTELEMKLEYFESRLLRNITNNFATHFHGSVATSGQANFGGHNQGITQENSAERHDNPNLLNSQFSKTNNIDTNENNKDNNMKNPFKKKKNVQGTDSESSDNEQNNSSRNTTVGSDVNTKEGNTNLGNATGDRADFSRRQGDNYGATIAGGNLNFGGGSQTLLGGRNENVSQTNYNSNSKSKLQEIEDEINAKIDKIYGSNVDESEKLKDLLWEVGNDVWEDVEKQINWQRNRETDKKIRSLGNKLGDIGLVKSFCKEKAEEAKLENKIEQPLR